MIFLGFCGPHTINSGGPRVRTCTHGAAFPVSWRGGRQLCITEFVSRNKQLAYVKRTGLTFYTPDDMNPLHSEERVYLSLSLPLDLLRLPLPLFSLWFEKNGAAVFLCSHQGHAVAYITATKLLAIVHPVYRERSVNFPSSTVPQSSLAAPVAALLYVDYAK